MREKIVYISEDDEEFKTKEECEAHELAFTLQEAKGIYLDRYKSASIAKFLLENYILTPKVPTVELEHLP